MDLSSGVTFRRPTSRILCILLFCVECLGCAPQIKLSPKLSGNLPSSLALLPQVYPGGIQLERIDYIRSVLAAELRNNGYLMVEDNIVDSICSSPACPQRSVLSEQFGVQGFVAIEIQSIAKTEFLAGYYNVISGTLRIEDQSGGELLSAKHTEHDKGGLAFNSGQVFQGVISHVKNYDVNRDNFLASRFAHNLVAALPKATNNNVLTPVEIESVGIQPATAEAHQICVSGTPRATAAILHRQTRPSLREVSPGKYCGVFRLDALLMTSPTVLVELRSPFGAAARKTLQIGEMDTGRIMPIAAKTNN